MKELVLFLRASVALRDLANRFIEAWILAQDFADLKEGDRRKKRRDALFSALSSPGLTNGERNEIRRALWELNH